MLKKFYAWFDYRFFVIFIFGVLLRIYALIVLPNAVDSRDYLIGAQGLLNFDYVMWRPPGFSFFVVPFILIVGDTILAVKLTSFTSGTLLIIASYFVFTKGSLKIFENNQNKYEKSKCVGLLVCLNISLNPTLIYNNGGGLREEFLMLVYVLIIYYIFITKNKESLKAYIILFLLISILTLAHDTTGIFLFVTIFFLFILSKIRILKFSIVTNVQMLLTFLSFILSSLLWIAYCYFRFGNAFLTFEVQRYWWEAEQSTNFYDIYGIIDAIIFGLNYGLVLEMQILFSLIGTVFILISILIILKYYKNKLILFVFFFLILNFLYLSIFIAPFGEARLLYYLFPFIYFLGFILIVDIWYNNRDMEVIYFNFLKWKNKINLNTFFFFYLITFLLKQILLFGYYFLGDLNAFDFSHNVELIYNIEFPFINVVSIIENIFLFSLIIVPTFRISDKDRI